MGTPSERQRLTAVSPSLVTVAFVLLGYLAFLVAGYAVLPAEPGHNVRALSLYIYAGLLLLALQWPIARSRSTWHNAYVFLTSAFAIAYAADAVFFRGDFLLDLPLTYYVLNLLAFIVFFYDAIERYRGQPQALRDQSGRIMILAANAASFAVLCLISWVLLRQPWLDAAPWNILPKIVLANPHEAMFVLFGLPFDINWLAFVDAVLGIAALIVAGLCVTSLAAQLGLNDRGGGGAAFARMVAQLGSRAVDEATRSLGLVLNPLIWLIPAFATAHFAQNVTGDIVRAATPQNNLDLAHIWQLFFTPFSASTGQTFTGAMADLGYAALSVAAVIFAVTWAEHNWQTVVQTLQNLRKGGSAIGLSLGVLLIVLALTNVLLIRLLGGQQATPFRLGPDALVAFGVAIVLIAVSFIRTTGDTAAAASAALDEPAGTQVS